nr:hypothetical protein [uncultured Pseudomonas sp.]
MLKMLKKLTIVISEFVIYSEDPHEECRTPFESRIPVERLARDNDGKYLDPVIAARWKKLGIDRSEVIRMRR